MMSVGAKGVISVASNIMPKELKDLYQAFLEEREIKKAIDMNARLLPLLQGLFIETNPIPVKEALYFMGMIEEEFRLPLCPASDASKEFLKDLLRGYGLLNRG
jgi:4-hydroxy-tetrahydrodipicolinate synthase